MTSCDEVVVRLLYIFIFNGNQYMNQYQRRSVTSTTRASGALEQERTASVTASAVAFDLRSAMM